MALDGLFLSCVSNSLKEYIGARIEKVSQPSKDCIILSLRHKIGNQKLLISSSPTSARIHFTSDSPENPAVPPMFCMLLRKHLQGGRLTEIRQILRDRILFLDFEVYNELGDLVTVSLCAEIMGHNSNIILINQNGVIIDAIRRINADVSSVRFVLPGVKYVLPPQQDKADIFALSESEILASLEGELALSSALTNSFSGFSPLISREASYFCAKNIDIRVDDLSNEQKDKLLFFISQIKKYITSPAAVTIFDKNGAPRDFSFMPIHQYGAAVLTKEADSIHALLDSFFTEKDRFERVKQKSGDLLKTVVNISDRIARKLSNQKKDLEKCSGKELLKQKGDIIYANLHLIDKGMSSIVLPNFYDENMAEIEISLDPKLNAAENGQKYYNEYRKADTAEKKLSELIKSGEAELKYIDSVFDSLSRASSEAELSIIRDELYEGRYIHKKTDKKQVKVKVDFLRYRSSDGFLILCGKNNVQNDKLTLKDSSKEDIWFHTQSIPGSHTVIITEGKSVTDSTLSEAAEIAAYNSKARLSSKVLVDYTEIKNVKKPSGAKPGMVIYTTYKTAVVSPDGEKIKSLLEK